MVRRTPHVGLRDRSRARRLRAEVAVLRVLALLLGVLVPHVINRNHFRYEEGVGPPPAPKNMRRKGQNLLPKPWIYVGRGSPLGNIYRPQSASHHSEELTREGALELYRHWLWKKLQANDPRVMLAMRSITDDAALVCSCAPKTCHADIVLRAWQWLRDHDRL